MAISPTNLSSEIIKQMKIYTKEVKEEIQIAKEDVSKELVADLKRDSPVRKTKNGGTYSKGWRVKKEKKSYKVHNAPSYQLTHLLEHGHAHRHGGRVNPVIHIAPNEEKAVREFLDRIERAIEPK